jgi:hypothetical protein
MNDLTLTDEDRKLLTEFCGECWHEWQYIKGPVCQELFACRKCGEHCKGIVSKEQKNRTFATPEDALVVVKKLVKKGKWREFRKIAHDKWSESRNLHYSFPVWAGGLAISDVWLFVDDPRRIPKLAAEFLREEKV